MSKSALSSVPIRLQTFSATFSGLSVALLATDILTIAGSASKIIRVKRIEFSGTQTTSAYDLINLIKRSSDNSGGASSTLTAVPYDSSNNAATATVKTYTTNPTLGAAVGTLYNVRHIFPSSPPSGNVTQDPIAFFEFGKEESQEIVLRGTSEVLALNLNATTLTGGVFNGFIEWTEEAL